MTAVETVFERMQKCEDAPAIFFQGKETSYQDLFERISTWDVELASYHVGQGTVCAVFGDYTTDVSALLLALLRRKAILVSLIRAVEMEMEELHAIAGTEVMITFAEGSWRFEKHAPRALNPLVDDFRKLGDPGLIVFSSGSTGKPKGILQNCERVMRKFLQERKGWRTVLFLMMDHFGGFNTFLSAFAYGGTAVCVPDRNPAAVCAVIEEARATLLPTTPTFLNLLRTSRVYQAHNLSSVELVTYGTEVMTEATLSTLRSIFPQAAFKQRYGLSELGVLRSRSESDGSVWVQIGGDGFETKVVDGILWVRSESSMVGYLNAPQPFDAEGWMCTGDHVEVRGEFMRILGRKSDAINVGGQKVFPAEIESVLLEVPNARAVTVSGQPHPVMGNIVVAGIVTDVPESIEALTVRLRKHCLARLARFKVPVRFQLIEQEVYSARFKKLRAEVKGEIHGTT